MAAPKQGSLVLRLALAWLACLLATTSSCNRVESGSPAGDNRGVVGTATVDSPESVKIAVINPFPRHVYFRVAVEKWGSDIGGWVVINPNVGLRISASKGGGFANMSPFETKHILWRTNETYVSMPLTEVRFRAKFSETNSVPIAEFTTTVFNVKQLLAPSTTVSIPTSVPPPSP